MLRFLTAGESHGKAIVGRAYMKETGEVLRKFGGDSRAELVRNRDAYVDSLG